MRSSRPKPLHRLCGRPMILHVLDALAELPVQKVVVVVGHRGEWVTKTLVDHAPALARPSSSSSRPSNSAPATRWPSGLTGLPDGLVDADGDVVVLPGDTPLVRPPTLASLVRHHRDTGAAATLLTAVLPDPTGYDRVVRGKDDAVVRVVEDADVTARTTPTSTRWPPPSTASGTPCWRRRCAGCAPWAAPGSTTSPASTPCSTTPGTGGVARGRRPHGGRRGERPGPAGGGRGRAARPHQRAVDAPRA